MTNVTGAAVGANANAIVNISNQLQTSTNSETRKLAYLIERLQSLVQAPNSGLSQDNQAMAMKLLNDIGEFGKNRQKAELQMSAKIALLALPGMLSQGTGLEKSQIEGSLQGIREIFGF